MHGSNSTVIGTMLPTDLLDILVCPVCNGELSAEAALQQICCLQCRLAFPVREGIPVMLVDEALSMVERIPESGDR